MFNLARLTAAAVCAATMLSVSVNASAAPLIWDSHTLSGSGASSVGYTWFSYAGTGGIWIQTDAPTINPMIVLMRDDGSLDASDLISSDDDSCIDPMCAPTNGGANAFLNLSSLSAGNYLLAVSASPMTPASVVARSSVTPLFGSHPVDVVITVTSSADSLTLNAGSVGGAAAAVPTTGTLPLLLAGLAGVGALLRRRQR